MVIPSPSRVAKFPGSAPWTWTMDRLSLSISQIVGSSQRIAIGRPVPLPKEMPSISLLWKIPVQIDSVILP